MRATTHIRYPLIVSFYLISIVMLSNGLGSCGQTGPLYLPSDSKGAASKQIVRPNATEPESTAIRINKEKENEEGSAVDNAD